MRADTACSVHIVSQGADESSLPDFSDDERAYQEKSWNSMIGCCIARHFAQEAYAKGEDNVLMNKVFPPTSRCMCTTSWAPLNLRCLNPLPTFALQRSSWSSTAESTRECSRTSVSASPPRFSPASSQARSGRPERFSTRQSSKQRLASTWPIAALFLFVNNLPCQNTSGNRKHNRQL